MPGVRARPIDTLARPRQSCPCASLQSRGLAITFAFAITGAALAGPKPLTLNDRVIQQGEFPPFLALPGPSTTLYNSPNKWVSVDTSLTDAQSKAEIAQLREDGFVAVLSRQLGTAQQEPFGGLSWVMQLRSATAAEAALAANIQYAKTSLKPPNTYTAFQVAGVESPVLVVTPQAAPVAPVTTSCLRMGPFCISLVLVGLPSRRTCQRKPNWSTQRRGFTSACTDTRPRNASSPTQPRYFFRRA
jgi:hypothetical protein